MIIVDDQGSKRSHLLLPGSKTAPSATRRPGPNAARLDMLRASA